MTKTFKGRCPGCYRRAHDGRCPSVDPVERETYIEELEAEIERLREVIPKTRDGGLAMPGMREHFISSGSGDVFSVEIVCLLAQARWSDGEESRIDAMSGYSTLEAAEAARDAAMKNQTPENENT